MHEDDRDDGAPAPPAPAGSPAPPPHQWLDTVEAIDAFAGAIARERHEHVALDTEGATLHRFVDRVYLLQLSTRDATAVIDPLSVGLPPSLGALLAGPDVEVVLHDADQDLRMLQRDFGLRVARIFDTRIAARLCGVAALSLSSLVERFLGVRLDKLHQTADFSARPLPAEIVAYAARDTAYLLPLRDRLVDLLWSLGRLAWAEEEMAALALAPRLDADRGPRHLRVKGARDLGPRALAILRELSDWREAVARSKDRPLFRVAPDELLVALALAPPESRQALSRQRGLPRNLRERDLEAILEAVRRGLAVPDDRLAPYPSPPPPPRRDRDVEARAARLRAARDEVAARLGLEPSFLFTRDQLERVARERPRSTEELAALPSVRRWQAAELAASFLRVLGR